SVNGGIKHILSIEAKSFLQMGKVVDHLHSCVETILVVTASDPYLVVTDCLELLDSHRMLDIPQLKYSTDELPYHNAYLRLTNTKIPFYASTNYEKVDLPIMLDVGGNVGWFSFLSVAHGVEVYVFELCKSSVLNGWSLSSNPEDNQVHPCLKGVGDIHGIQEDMFRINLRNPGSFSFLEEAAQQSKAQTMEGGKLQLVTLNALVGGQNWLANDEGSTATVIAILKVDVEGLKLKVLLGAKKLLRSHKVRYIFMEWKKTLVSQDWDDMCSILLDSGYELYKTGMWMGPSDVVMAKYADETELAEYMGDLSAKSKVLGHQ
ncbi:hypothetical protein ACHAXA_003549, partial [Cyclostephanos tholiformis]